MADRRVHAQRVEQVAHAAADVLQQRGDVPFAARRRQPALIVGHRSSQRRSLRGSGSEHLHRIHPTSSFQQ